MKKANPLALIFLFKYTWLILTTFHISTFVLAQDKEEEKELYTFTVVKEVPSTCVKSQAKSGTCWSYAACSFLEAEILRTTKQETDLSEMFYVRKIYPEKAMNYVRRHGTANFSQGGQAHDVLQVVGKYGMTPEEVYGGIEYGLDHHNHAELVTILTSLLEGVVENRGEALTTKWLDAFEAVLDVYLGKVPETFKFNGKEYSPKSFATDVVKINPDDYIELTSYTHHPFYTLFNLEVPDNWSNWLYYNLPLDELMTVIDNAINTNLTICWDGDVSGAEFSHKKGYAVVPMTNTSSLTKEEAIQLFSNVVPEKTIDQQMRQMTFDNYTTTDDHLMHITGTAKDQFGTFYYVTKNSWGTDSNKQGGKVYLSTSFIRLNTVAIMVHKDAVPEEIRKKMGIK